MTAAELFSSLLQLALVTGGAFLVLCLVSSYLRFQKMAQQAEAATENDAHGGEAFQMQVAHRLGTGHKDQRPFSVLMVGLENERGGEGREEELHQHLVGLIRPRVRQSDALLRLEPRVYGLLIDAPGEISRSVAERIQGACRESSFRLDSGEMLRLETVVGMATFPSAGERLTELMEAAGSALDEARSQGDYALAEAAAETPPEPEPRATPADPLAGISVSQRNLVDPDTGFLQYQHLASLLQKTVAQHRRDERDISLLMVEIDHVERYRDHYGEGGVTAIYNHLGCLAQNIFRETDLLGRYGDERLMCILSCSPKAGLIAAQRLSTEVKGMQIEFSGTSLKVTISVGVAGYPDQGGVTRKLVEFSRLALEVARAKGRNQCILYERGLEIPREALPTEQAY